MSIDSVLTVIGLIITVYTIIPRYKQLEYGLTRGGTEIFVLICGALVVFYLQFYSSFSSVGLTPELGLKKYELNPQNVSFLVVLITFIFLWASYEFRKVDRKNISKLKILVEELMCEGKYSELFDLLRSRLGEIDKVRKPKGFLFILKEKLKSKQLSRLPAVDHQTLMRLIQIAEGHGTKVQKKETTCKNYVVIELIGFLKKINHKGLSCLINLFPNYEDGQAAAAELINEIYTSESFAKSIAEINPYLIENLLQHQFRENADLVGLYLKAMMEKPNSILFKEIQQGLAQRGGEIGFIFPSSNRILKATLENAQKAHDWGVYQGVGESVIKDLRLRRKMEIDSYNFPMEDFKEEGQKSSKVYNGIYFFDIMVRQALIQNIQWHMWLYYFYHFTEEILKNVDREAEIDLNTEWPTPYHYLIYQLFSILEDWVRTVVDYDLSIEQENVKLERAGATHENGNIIKSAMLCYGNCLNKLFCSPKINDKFKTYIADMAFRLYFDIAANEKLSLYKTAFANILKSGGYFSTKSTEYHAQLKRVYNQLDFAEFQIEREEDFKELGKFLFG